MILDETHEYELSEKPWALFRQEAVNYKVREANQNPTMFPHRNPYQPIKVIMP